MKNTNKEPTTLVKKCIVDALLLLMNEKDFDEISITEICNKAGVSRMAYYRNYYTKKDIIIEYLKDIAADLKKKVIVGKKIVHILIKTSLDFYSRILKNMLILSKL